MGVLHIILGVAWLIGGCGAATSIRRDESRDEFRVGSGACLEEVVRGLDNLLGVCEAWQAIRECSQSRSPQAACSKVLGPAGNLITQDISEDVTLGPRTTKHTAKWHAAFTRCATSGKDCAAAVLLQKPVMQSVQKGLRQLLASPSCATGGAFSHTKLSSTDDIACAEDAPNGYLPTPSGGLLKLVRQARQASPQAALTKFPLRGVVQWAEPNIELPAERNDEDVTDDAATLEGQTAEGNDPEDDDGEQ
mmetsp:Transcript_38462/g.88780  ORF Transcript_38462/g.88780 Transcript_38462/m.88780 type:complete len:249 (-) Transcript_38462:42-788(-)